MKWLQLKISLKSWTVPTYASSISRSEEEEEEDDDNDILTNLLNQGIQEQDDNDETDNSVEENQVGTGARDVCEVVDDNGDIDTFEARQELFAWAFNLINKEPHDKNDKMIEQLRRKTKTKIDHLNLLSLCLLDGWPINDKVLENLLRTWSEMKTLTSPIIQLEDGCDEVFDTTVAILKGKYVIEDAVKYLNKEHHALIYLTEKKLVEMKNAIDSPILQIIDILESIIKNCLHRAKGNESELDCMEDCYYTIMKIVFRGPQYKFQLGEQACVKSKAVRERNEKDYSKGGVFSTTHNIMGRKVDLLVSSHDQNISSCEWKANNVTPSTVRKQECKNVRTNTCILESLWTLPFDPEDFDPKSFHIMYMDWVGKYTKKIYAWRCTIIITVIIDIHSHTTIFVIIGHDGVLNIIKKDEDVFVVNKLGDMFIPVTIYDINAKFKKSIQLLYTWKVSLTYSYILAMNNLDEVIKLLPAAQAEKLRQEKKSKKIIIRSPGETSAADFFYSQE
ncbi:hypothetical protein INT45_000401 [Circinella minor]|uniref:Uncharacterized protein n=1 Tax=Circinella minor TaxID=1195481 RepID=A0A8H7RUY1_9FUNG|nr:hypothetical protein INT45_000401 [Circinella minor]